MSVVDRDRGLSAIRTQDIQSGEKLVGRDSTPHDRALMAGLLEQRLSELARLRGAPLDEGEASAMVFVPWVGNSGPRAVRSPEDHALSAEPAAPAEGASVFSSVTTLARNLADRAIDSVTLTTMFLDRIARINPMLNAVSVMCPDEALAAAAASDARRTADQARGPLDGIPYLAKDLIDTCGVVTERGSAYHFGRVPTVDAFVITTLHDAGAVLLGKAACGELGYGDVNARAQTLNPWNPAEGASGSSSGSAAAVAAGLCAFALGTETLGSIVMPAARCGVIGLRPSFGCVSVEGVMPLAPSLDRVGVLARSAVDARCVLNCIEAINPGDRHQRRRYQGPIATSVASELRIGYVRRWLHPSHADPLDRTALELAQKAGLNVVPIEWPALSADLFRAILDIESASQFEWLVDDADPVAGVDAMGWTNLWRAARHYPAVDYVTLMRRRLVASRQIAEALTDVDALLAPHHADHLLVATSVSGHPCVALPVGLTRRPARDLFDRPLPGAPAKVAVPHAVSLIGRIDDEATLLDIAGRIERTRGAMPHPPL